MTIGETKLVFPGLAGFYASWRDIAYTLVRVIIGYIVFMHGWAKVTGAGVAGVSALMARQGLEPATLFALAAHRPVYAVFRGGARRRIGHRLPDRAFQSGIFYQPGWVRIRASARYCDVRHRDTRRWTLLG